MEDVYYNMTDAEVQADAERFCESLNPVKQRTPVVPPSMEELTEREAMTDAEVSENVENWLCAMENDRKRIK